MTTACLHCKTGYLYPDDEGVPTCLQCARKVSPLVPLPLPSGSLDVKEFKRGPRQMGLPM